MIRFKQFISEMAFAQTDEVKEDEVMQSISKFGDTPLLWRGQTAGRKIGRSVILYSGVVHVINDREGFYGKIDNVTSKVISLLKLESQPIFCTFDKTQANFFGEAGVIVPQDPFTLHWNPKIRDLVARDDKKLTASQIAKGYKSTTELNTIHDGEIILVCKEYYWITPSKFFNLAKKSKFNKFKTIDEIKTYSDLYEVYKGYKSYLKWLDKRREND